MIIAKTREGIIHNSTVRANHKSADISILVNNLEEPTGQMLNLFSQRLATIPAVSPHEAKT